MTLTNLQAFLLILILAVGTFLTRVLPFLIFPDSKKPPKIINYLSTVLPAATMGLLIVYCLKNVSVIAYPYGIPELISIAVSAFLHIKKGNVLLSIGVGTLLYMILVQFVF